MKKNPKANVHVKIDAVLWEQSLPVIREMGFSNSGFFEMMLRRFIQAETAPLGQLINDVLEDVVKTKFGVGTKKKSRRL
jgi:antitoxin component of RelBE/YafQ-DinJ toxin-antitoxin module